MNPELNEPDQPTQGLWGPPSTSPSTGGSPVSRSTPAVVAQGPDPSGSWQPAMSPVRGGWPSWQAKIAGCTAILLIAAAVLLGLTLRAASSHRTTVRAGANAGSRQHPAAGNTVPLQAFSSTSSSSSSVVTSAAPGLAAARVDALLTRSQNARAGIGTAISRVLQCRGDESDIATFEGAAAVRRQISAELNPVDFAVLPSGSTIRAYLTQLSAFSADADQAYATWAEDQVGCSENASTTDPAFGQGDSFSRQATRAKLGFVSLWNPIAASFHLPARASSEI